MSSTPPPPPHVHASGRPLPLGAGRGTLPVLWWTPTTLPVSGLVWLQHGYARKPRHLASVAAALVANGLMVAMPTVESFRRARSINDNEHLDAIGSALGRVTGAGGLAAQVAGAANATVSAGALDGVVLVAHSAGCGVAARAASRACGEGTVVRGLVLLDATDNLAKSFAGSIADLAECDVRGVFAAPSRCNRRGQGADLLAAARTGFVGVRVTTGTHCDAEGDDTDVVCRRLCGRPDPANVALLREITTGWTSDLARGEVTPHWLPGGARLDEETRAGRVEALYAPG